MDLQFIERTRLDSFKYLAEIEEQTVEVSIIFKDGKFSEVTHALSETGENKRETYRLFALINQFIDNAEAKLKKETEPIVKEVPVAVPVPPKPRLFNELVDSLISDVKAMSDDQRRLFMKKLSEEVRANMFPPLTGGASAKPVEPSNTRITPHIAPAGPSGGSPAVEEKKREVKTPPFEIIKKEVVGKTSSQLTEQTVNDLRERFRQFPPTTTISKEARRLGMTNQGVVNIVTGASWKQASVKPLSRAEWENHKKAVAQQRKAHKHTH